MLRALGASLAIAATTGCFSKPPPPGSGEDGDGGLPVEQPNIAFVTSRSFLLVELRSLERADTWCMEAAQNASPPLAGTYKAWLSTTAEPAQNRFGSARGWLRTDGKPFIDSIDDLVTSLEIYYPLRLDENGNDVLLAEPNGGMVATGTNKAGNKSLFNCGDLAGAGEMTYGYAHAGGEDWTDANAFACGGSVMMRLYCLGTDRVSRVDAPTASGPRIFVTENPITLTGGGIAALDSRCAADAAAADPPLEGTFVAVVASSTASALSRIAGGGTEPWVRVDGVEVSADLTTFTAPINVSAKQHYIEGDFVWSGALDATGTATTNCADWTNPPGSGDTPSGFLTRSNEDAFGSLSLNLPCQAINTRAYCAQVR